MENQLLKFNNEEITKQSLKDNCDAIILAVENGEIDSISAMIRVKHLEEITKDLKKRLFDFADIQFMNDKEGKSIIRENAEITQVEKKASLDYSQDAEYSKIASDLKERKELLDTSRKMSEKGQELVVDGELIPVLNDKGFGSVYFKIKLK